MATSKTKFTFPRVVTEVIDNSISTEQVSRNSDLHVPLFPIVSSMGEPWKIFYGSGTDIKAEFGTDVFSTIGDYFSHSNQAASMASAYQNICVVRVNGNTAPAYNNVEYSITKDTDNSYIVTLTPNDVVSEPQLDISKGNAKFPLFKLTAVAGGSAYNKYGIRITTDGDFVSGYALYSIQLLKNVKTGWVAISNIYGSTTTTGVLSSDSVLDEENNEISLIALINSTYANLPFTIELNDIYLQTIYNKLITDDLETNLEKPNYLGINWLSSDVELSETVTLKINTSTVLDYTIFDLKNGTDRTEDEKNTSLSKYLDDCFYSYLSVEHDDLYDQFRYPFTHMYDTGYTLETKFLMSQLYAIRDDLIIDWSTYIMTNKDGSENRKPSTFQEDLAMAHTITANVATIPESSVYGTPFMRGNIFGQTGSISSSNNKRQMSYVLNTLVARCNSQSGETIKNLLTPRPYNVVSVFEDVSYTISIPTLKQQAWDACMNLAQYADTNVWFYPDFKSMYTKENSLLSSTTIVDRITYIKKIDRYEWTYHTGSTDPIDSQIPYITKELDRKILAALGNTITIETSAVQTVSDKVDGRSVTITNAVSFGSPISKWNILIPVSVTVNTSAS